MLHLLHPGLVHFSVALLFVGALCEAAGLLLDRKPATRFGGTLTVIGTLSLLPTIVTGYLAANSVVVREAAHGTLQLHELNGWLVLGLFVALLFWKAWLRGELPSRQRPLYAALLLIGALLVATGAWLGGELVYLHGTGVAGR